MTPSALYRSLRRRHGRPSGQWSLWCKRPKTLPEKDLVILESVLTQRANWRNVQAAVERMKRARALRLKAVAALPRSTLQELIRPSGFYRQKTERLAVVCAFFLARGGAAGCRGEDTAALREGLLDLKGIGPETCDDILCYALERPVFVVDEYTRRIARDLGLTRDLSYDGLQRFFESGLRRDWRLFQDFHALIVTDGKSIGKDGPAAEGRGLRVTGRSRKN